MTYVHEPLPHMIELTVHKAHSDEADLRSGDLQFHKPSAK